MRNLLSQDDDQELVNQTPPGGAFANLNPDQQNAYMGASRRLRASKRGLSTATGRRRIMGVDNQQQAQASYAQAHKNDGFFAKATAARAADPSRPQAPKPKPPTGMAFAQGGGQALNTDGSNANRQPVIRYGGNARPPGYDATDDDTPTPPVVKKPGGVVTPAAQGVDEVRGYGKDAKLDAQAGAFDGVKKRKTALA